MLAPLCWSPARLPASAKGPRKPPPLWSRAGRRPALTAWSTSPIKRASIERQTGRNLRREAKACDLRAIPAALRETARHGGAAAGSARLRQGADRKGGERL